MTFDWLANELNGVTPGAMHAWYTNDDTEWYPENPSGAAAPISATLAGDVYSANVTTDHLSGWTFGSWNVTLPVNLMRFDGAKTEEGAYLYWEVTQEEALSHYIVEKRTDKQDFLPIGEVEAHNAVGFFDYGLSDTDFNESAYYRLVMVGEDGQRSYSQVVYLDKEGQLTKLKLFPNPSNHSLNLSINGLLTGDEVLQVAVFDVQGRRVWSGNQNLTQTNHELRKLAGELAEGMYFFQIHYQGQEYSKRLIKH